MRRKMQGQGRAFPFLSKGNYYSMFAKVCDLIASHNCLLGRWGLIAVPKTLSKHKVMDPLPTGMGWPSKGEMIQSRYRTAVNAWAQQQKLCEI